MLHCDKSYIAIFLKMAYTLCMKHNEVKMKARRKSPTFLFLILFLNSLQADAKSSYFGANLAIPSNWNGMVIFTNLFLQYQI